MFSKDMPSSTSIAPKTALVQLEVEKASGLALALLLPLLLSSLRSVPMLGRCMRKNMYTPMRSCSATARRTGHGVI